jgi:Cu(I)/Ag(I) efflux system membrane fusion protein
MIKELVPDFLSETPEEFRIQLTKVLNAYLSIKESLVAADAKTAKKDASVLLNALKSVDMKLLDGEAHDYWMVQLKILNEKIKLITGTDNIDTQRKEFKPFSTSMINVMKSFGVSDKTIYVQYCPMADDDKGGYWLSTESQISNPYFGDMMLRCGEVKDTIQ